MNKSKRTPREILGELAGYASMCWNPRPIGAFDSTEAQKGVAQALDELCLNINKKEVIDDYEEGTLDIKVRKHWYQFWLPKSVSYGFFCRIGKDIKVTLIPNVYAGLTLMGEIDETFNDR